METLSAGIDLGTTNSCLAVLQGDQPVVIPNDLGEPITPSVVSVQPEGIIVGRKARSFLLTHPASTFASIKRKMGERYTRTVLGREYTPESVSALILSHLKQSGERHLGRTLTDAAANSAVSGGVGLLSPSPGRRNRARITWLGTSGPFRKSL